MKAEISFDTVIPEEGDRFIEGCYRLDGRDWEVFFFTQSYKGESKVVTDGVWRSGVTGVAVRFPKDKRMNKESVKQVLSDVLGVTEWSEVRGPDSLQLK